MLKTFWPLALLALPDFAYATNWDHLLDQQGGTNVHFGVLLSGPQIFSRNSDEFFVPASNMKIITAAAALDRLGPDYRFGTKIEWQAIRPRDPSVITHFKLTGSGDPTWGMVEFGSSLTSQIDELTDLLYQKGVREIHGAIQLQESDSRWENKSIPHGWEQDDLLECYGAQARSFNLAMGCGTYAVRSPAKGEWFEPGIPALVKQSIRSGPVTALAVSATDQGFLISGTFKTGDSARWFLLPVNDGKGWVLNLLTASLKKRGILLRPSEPSHSKGENHAIIYYSPTLAEILKPMLKISLNLLADSLFKKMGERLGDHSPDLFVAGRYAVEEFLEKHSFNSHFFFYDGSGLSRENQITPSGLFSLMEKFTHLPFFPFIWDALSIAGVDGTLKGRMKGTSAENVLRGKTGTLDGVYNLSGYIPRRDRQENAIGFSPFVILTHTTPTYREVARAAEDRVGAELSR